MKLIPKLLLALLLSATAYAEYEECKRRSKSAAGGGAEQKCGTP